MSDRVPFGTYNDSVTPANSSGFCGFPFPPTALGADAHHPIAVTLADCIEMYWRVKNWNLSTDITFTDSSTTPPTLYTMPNGDMTPNTSNATRELDLINPISHEWGLSDGTWSVAFDAPSTSFIPGGAINESSGVYYPIIFISAGTAGGGVAASFDPAAVGPPYVPSGSFTGSVKGYPVTVYMFANSSVPTASISGSFLDLTPVEWWPYAATNGSPIWDTTTGAQLQSPLN